MKKTLLFLLIIIALAIPVVISCTATKAGNLSEKKINLSDISRKSKVYEGKEVTLEGFFYGWKHGDCKYPPTFSNMQISRSDWAFGDGTWCCFVKGPIPQGLESSPEKPVPIILTALVRNKEGKIYLEYVKLIK